MFGTWHEHLAFGADGGVAGWGASQWAECTTSTTHLRAMWGGSQRFG